MYVPRSTIYREPTCDEFSDCLLTDGDFDKSKSSKKSRVVRPYKRSAPPRGTLSIRNLGGYKPNESNYEKI